MEIQFQPKHVAIMRGVRWQQLIQRAAEHQLGRRAVATALDPVLRRSSRCVLLYAFSLLPLLKAALSHGADNGADKEAYHDDHNPLKGP